jgi:murein DD-endopeptidase MepM/ murein hydrolase activator NlpD
MNEQFHIMITRDRGKILRFPCTTKKLRILFSASIFILLFLVITSIFSISLFTKNRTISSNILELKTKIDINEKTIAQHTKTFEAQRLELSLQLTKLELSKAKQAATFKEEKNVLMSTAVSELNERSELIEKIMHTIGINLDERKTEGTGNSGGPFIPQSETGYDDLLYRTDTYLKKIQYIPLGRPVQGTITSRFGKRKDPVNKKKGFHTGVDFRGKRGEKIYATADGIVQKAFVNGGYGKYLSIGHGNGYTTNFAHLQTFLVKKGARVERGRLIGLVGNTGRSTGPHLHYEIKLDKKPINPQKFMKFANLLESNPISPEKK